MTSFVSITLVSDPSRFYPNHSPPVAFPPSRAVVGWLSDPPAPGRLEEKRTFALPRTKLAHSEKDVAGAGLPEWSAKGIVGAS